MKEKILLCILFSFLTIFLPIFVDKLDAFHFNSLVGISSNFLYGKNEYFCTFLRIASVITCILSNYKSIIFNPFFIIHLAKRGNDIIFICILTHIIEKKNNCIFIIIICILRHLAIIPSPGINLLWLFNSHFYTQFRSEANYLVISFQLIGLYITRNIKNKYIPLYLYFIFDPIGDWASLSLLMTLIIHRMGNSNSNKFSFIMLIFGIILSQSSFYSWWTIGIGNVNYSLVSSIICSIALLIPIIN